MKNIRSKFETELQKLKSVVNFEYNDLVINNEKINRLEHIIMIMDAISNVITNRRKRGASEQNINAYKQYLITDIWRNNDVITKYISEIV